MATTLTATLTKPGSAHKSKRDDDRWKKSGSQVDYSRQEEADQHFGGQYLDNWTERKATV